MKKYLFGLSAILFAFVLNAFTLPEKRKTKVLDDYFWYEVDGSNAVGLPKNGTAQNITTALGYVSGCDDASGTKCLVGFGNEQDTPVAVPFDNDENTIYHN
jgi:hypothetical protein